MTQRQRAPASPAPSGLVVLADVIADAIRDALSPLRERVAQLEARTDALTASGDAVRDTLTTIRADMASMGNRVAAVEALPGTNGQGTD